MLARLIPWLLVVAVSAVCFGIVRRASNVAAESVRVAEAKQLEAQGQIVAEQESKAELNKDIEAALKDNAELQKELDEVLKVAPDARVTRVVRASTGPVAACGALRPPEPSQCDCTPCLVAPGDTMQIGFTELGLETKRGNSLLKGTAKCERLLPEPRTVIAEKALDEKLSEVSELAPLPDTRWPWYTHLAIGVGAGLAAGLYLGRK
jgi:hypothetical protein